MKIARAIKIASAIKIAKAIRIATATVIRIKLKNTNLSGNAEGVVNGYWLRGCTSWIAPS